MVTSLDKDVAVYLYKCLLRRQQALQCLRPIGGVDVAPFDTAVETLSFSIPPEMVCEIEKQMRVTHAKNIEVYVDASAKDHDSPALPNRVSVSLIVQEDGKTLYERADYIGSYIALTVHDKPITFDITVNVAEYIALIRALEFIVDNDVKGNVTIYSDSQLVVNQVNFVSSARAPKLIVLRDYARRLMERIRGIQVVHLSREDNSSADALARAVVSEAEDG